MLRRLMIIIGLIFMGYAVPIMRAAHQRAVRCTNGTLHSHSGTFIMANCANTTQAYLLGIILLVVGALTTLIGLLVGGSESAKRRASERAFKKALKSGAYDFDPDRLDPEKNLGRFKRAAEETRRREAAASDPVPWDQKFLTPFPDQSDGGSDGRPGGDADSLREHPSTEISQSQSQKSAEEDQ
jgi:hypothetical protein